MTHISWHWDETKVLLCYSKKWAVNSPFKRNQPVSEWLFYFCIETLSITRLVIIIHLDPRNFISQITDIFCQRAKYTWNLSKILLSSWNNDGELRLHQNLYNRMKKAQ